MTKRWVLRGLLTVAVVVSGQAVLPGSAQAADLCVSGTPMQGTASSTLTPTDDEDRWQANGYSATEVSISASNTGFVVEVLDGLCTPLCTIARGSSGRCSTGASGTLHIFVYGLAPDGYGTYTLRVTSTLPVAVPPQPCTTVAGTTSCVVVTPGTPQQQAYVTGAQVGPGTAHHLAGTVDIYSFPLPTGGSVTAPCVVLTNDGAPLDPCAAAGGSFQSRVSFLYDQLVAAPSPTLVTVTSARVCDATYTVTVGGVGLNNFPALAIC